MIRRKDWRRSRGPSDRAQYLVEDFNESEVVFNSHNTHSCVRFDTGAFLSSCTPELATHDYSTDGVELRFNLAGLADEFDVACCGFLMNPQGQDRHQRREADRPGPKSGQAASRFYR